MVLLHGFIKKAHKTPQPRSCGGDQTQERGGAMTNPHVGSSFDEFLAEEDILEEVEAIAIKRILARQVSEAMKAQRLTKKAMAEPMGTSRSALDRLLDPDNTSATLRTLQKAASTVKRRLRLELV
jgi:hypothetical protein